MLRVGGQRKRNRRSWTPEPAVTWSLESKALRSWDYSAQVFNRSPAIACCQEQKSCFVKSLCDALFPEGAAGEILPKLWKPLRCSNSFRGISYGCNLLQFYGASNITAKIYLWIPWFAWHWKPQMRLVILECDNQSAWSHNGRNSAKRPLEHDTRSWRNI